MNKNVLFLTYSILVALGLIGAILLLMITPQHFATFSGFMLVMLGLVASTATNFWSLGKTKKELQNTNKEIENVKVETSEKLDVVQKQTNGTLTKLIDRNRELVDLVVAKDIEIAILKGQGNA